MKCFILALCLSLYAFSAMANIAYTKDVNLPHKERLILEDMVCIKPYGLKANTIQGHKDVQSRAAFESALVQCQSHDKFRGNPLHYQAGCAFHTEQWHCNKAGLEVTVSINGKDITIEPWDISPEAAYQILNKISTYGTFQNIPMADAIGSSCHIAPLKDGETVELNCASIITVSSWCPQPKITNCPRVVFVSPQPVL